jgi:predicted TIM-barrel fold metal-dependent hydrolase
MNALATGLLAEIARIPCVNSHSHLMPEKERLAQDVDALTLFKHAYLHADLVTAGLPAEAGERIFATAVPMAERWRIFEPYWKRIRLTGYTQCVVEAFRDLFGFADLSAATVGPISEAMRQSARPGFYAEILRTRGNIVVSAVQMEDLIEVDRSLFLPMPRLNRFSTLRSREQVQAIERDYDVGIASLQDLVTAIERTCATWKGAQVAAIKLSQSYHRRMDFQARDRAEAATVFDGLLSGDYAGLESADGRLLEDYLVFECCRAASGVGLTIQFHLGMRAGNNGSLEGADPTPMIELFRAFPEASFDLSHAGYPYLREAGVIGKTFANVNLNMSWIHIISPIGSREALREWLRMVPYNKIIGFGDDLQHVETVYGHLKMARQNAALVLAELVEEGLISESTAIDVATAIFRDNPARLYGVRTPS